MAAEADGQTVQIDGQRVKLTNLDKVLYPATGTTKGEVLAYYAQIAPVMLPYLAGRGATRKRWPNGIGDDARPEMAFFTKNLDSGTPDWVPRRTLTHSDRVVAYPLIDDLATLTMMAQLASLEIHVPQWRFGPDGTPQNPDRLVMDLDPGPGVGLAECVEVAKMTRDLLAGIGLQVMPVTSGSKGLHLYAALDGEQTSDEASDLARELARGLQSAHPDLVVSEMKKSLRVGKVFIDWSQNNAANTTVAPYSLRGRPHPTVAAPRTWAELDEPGLHQLEFPEVLALVEERGDPLAVILAGGRPDRLQTYRAKRDARRTPEPVPPAPPAADADGQSFVIQEHHARRLHWDFRLERAGVLVSWALPRGVPTDPKRNNLAVQTEDHPLEYGTFEGTIPKGEYGGGEVTIWDAGSYELHKWRDGKEVIVTLHGRPDGGLVAADGPRGTPDGGTTVALIHTGGGGEDKNWLIHRMEAAPDYRETAAPEKPFPPEIRPMLADAAAPSDFRNADAWTYEMKWDGVRVGAYLEGRRTKLVTRRSRDVTATYPEVSEALGWLGLSDTVLDGEVVALDEQGRPSFERLQQRMNLTKTADINTLRASIPVQLYVFDLLRLHGTPYLDRRYAERRKALADLLGSATGRVQAPPAFEGDLSAAIDVSLALGLEGVMAKRNDSVYEPGQRNHSWLKIKHRLDADVVVGGWRPGQGNRDGGLGSLLVGVYEGDRLHYAGRVGSGFSAAELRQAEAMLAELTRPDCPFDDVPALDARDARWVEPKLVCQVLFRGWTTTGRLWQPSWRGWRDDRDPLSVLREDVPAFADAP